MHKWCAHAAVPWIFHARTELIINSRCTFCISTSTHTHITYESVISKFAIHSTYFSMFEPCYFLLHFCYSRWLSSPNLIYSMRTKEKMYEPPVRLIWMQKSNRQSGMFVMKCSSFRRHKNICATARGHSERKREREKEFTIETKVAKR